MFSSFEWSVALRYLRARRSDKFISVIAGFSLVGICLGVMVLIVVMSVMNGFRIELLGRVLGVNHHVVVYGYGGEIQDYEDLTGRIKQVAGVTRVFPAIDGQVLASSKNNAGGAILRGVPEISLRENEYVGPNIIEGTLDGFDEGRKIAIGVQMAQRLNVRVGDDLTLISPQGTATPFGTAPRIMAYEVSAIFEVGVYQYDDGIIFMPLEEAQVFFKLYDVVRLIEIFTEDPDDIDGISNEIAILAGNQGYVSDWRQMNQSLFTALQVERNVMFIILTLIILIAAFNIISSMIILVKDKSKDVAILRTMGASGKSLMKIFIIAGGAIGFFGTLLGLGFGLLLTLNIQSIQKFLNWVFGQDLWTAEVRFLTEMPAEMKTSETVAIVLIAFLISFLATLPPARRAAKLDPVEILRNEG